MRLRPNETCPIHRSRSCCGRERGSRTTLSRAGVQRIPDPHHSRGYRELRSPAEMRRLLNVKIIKQNRVCAICQEEFTDYNDIVPDHLNPKGMGEHGATSIRITSRQCTTGAIQKRAQRESAPSPLFWRPRDVDTGFRASFLRQL